MKNQNFIFILPFPNLLSLVVVDLSRSALSFLPLDMALDLRILTWRWSRVVGWRGAPYLYRIIFFSLAYCAELPFFSLCTELSVVN
jgi:hypothetical protein